MGIYVHLAVVVDRVSDAAWRAIYERARRVAKQWTPRPLSLAGRQASAVQIAQYVFDVETTEGLHLVGDAETLTTGESFVFPAKLDPPMFRHAREGSPASSDDDVLVAIARPDASDHARHVHWRNLFGNKTQGLPYHTLIVALGMLVEHSLPGTAVVYGDISVRDGEQAQRGLASILGEDLELPVVVDAPHLRRRLAAAMEGDVLDQAIRALSPPNPHVDAILGDLLGLLRSRPEMSLPYELEHVVDRTLAALARRTMECGIYLTSKAWDAIEAADLHELAFLYGAVCRTTMSWEVHQAVRALLENRALRQAGPTPPRGSTVSASPISVTQRSM